jgi:hypothetical protein
MVGNSIAPTVFEIEQQRRVSVERELREELKRSKKEADLILRDAELEAQRVLKHIQDDGRASAKDNDLNHTTAEAAEQIRQTTHEEAVVRRRRPSIISATSATAGEEEMILEDECANRKGGILCFQTTVVFVVFFSCFAFIIVDHLKLSIYQKRWWW